MKFHEQLGYTLDVEGDDALNHVAVESEVVQDLHWADCFAGLERDLEPEPVAKNEVGGEAVPRGGAGAAETSLAWEESVSVRCRWK